MDREVRDSGIQPSREEIPMERRPSVHMIRPQSSDWAGGGGASSRDAGHNKRLRFVRAVDVAIDTARDFAAKHDLLLNKEILPYGRLIYLVSYTRSGIDNDTTISGKTFIYS